MEPVLSFIVPIYKVEAYLEKCLKSLLYQSLREIEIIAVNDGSPDDSQKIIDRFAALFPEKIVSVKKENGGLSDARNAGIEKARGKYLAFPDGDDWLDLDFAERMVKKAEEENADLAVCDVRYVWENGKFSETKSGFSPAKNQEEMKKNFISFYPAVWNKIYRRELFFETGLRFQKGVLFEDVEFLHRLFPYVKSCAVVDFALYNYRQREGSITEKPTEGLFDHLKNWAGIVRFYKENGFFEPYREELEFAAARYLLGTFLKRARYLSRENFDRAVKEAFLFLQKEFPHYKRNKYCRKSLKGWYLIALTENGARRLWKGQKA